MNSYMQMKKFLDHNDYKYNMGHVVAQDLNIDYIIGNKKANQYRTDVHFSVESLANDRIFMPGLDEQLLHTGFNDNWQDFIFNKSKNTLTIESKNSNNKFGEPYKVIIYG